MKKKNMKFCPYCGSKNVVFCKLPIGTLVDPAPSIFVVLKNAFQKKYKCEDCGKKFY